MPSHETYSLVFPQEPPSPWCWVHSPSTILWAQLLSLGYQTLSSLPLLVISVLGTTILPRKPALLPCWLFGSLNRLFSSSLLKLMLMLLLCTELLFLPHKPTELHPSLSCEFKHHCLYSAFLKTCLKKDKYLLLYYSIYQLWHFSYWYNNLFTYVSWLRKLGYSLCIPLVHHWLSLCWEMDPGMLFVDSLMDALLDGQMDGWAGREMNEWITKWDREYYRPDKRRVTMDIALEKKIFFMKTFVG